MIDLQTLYDEHPLNEQEILAKLEQAGKDLANLGPEDLFDFDQDHYGGVEATALLAQKLELGAHSRVLDVCSGLGGPARYVAHRFGCRVVGVDLNRSRTAGATALTARVGLEGLVSHVRGDATALDFGADSFDGALSQEAFLHIPDKEALLAGCYRVIRPGGRLAFTDWIALEGLDSGSRLRLRDTIAATGLTDATSYLSSLEAAGFRDLAWEDLSQWWRGILRERLEMYKSLREETVRRFGRERHDKYIAAYEFFVASIESGVLGGGRFTALK